MSQHETKGPLPIELSDAETRLLLHRPSMRDAISEWLTDESGKLVGVSPNVIARLADLIANW